MNKSKKILLEAHNFPLEMTLEGQGWQDPSLVKSEIIQQVLESLRMLTSVLP